MTDELSELKSKLNAIDKLVQRHDKIVWVIAVIAVIFGLAGGWGAKTLSSMQNTLSETKSELDEFNKHVESKKEDFNLHVVSKRTEFEDDINKKKNDALDSFIENFELKVFYGEKAQNGAADSMTYSDLEILEDGQYLAWGTYACRSKQGRYPEEWFWLIEEGKEPLQKSRRYTQKQCQVASATDSKTSHPIAIRLKKGDILRFEAKGWGRGENFYYNAELFAIKINPIKK